MSKLTKLFAISMAIICFLATFVAAVNSDDESQRDEIWNAPEEIIVYGDANDDGIVDINDLALLRKYLANFNPATGESTQEVSKGADNNGDGTINTKDLILLRKYLAGFNPATGESTEALGPKQ